MEVCAVGDGANDELMIREAHCGLGIGIEPTADTKSFSDRQVMRVRVLFIDLSSVAKTNSFVEQIEKFSCLAPFLFEQCPRTLSNELSVVHLLLFKGIVIGLSSLLYTWYDMPFPHCIFVTLCLGTLDPARLSSMSPPPSPSITFSSPRPCSSLVLSTLRTQTVFCSSIPNCIDRSAICLLKLSGVGHCLLSPSPSFLFAYY